MRLVQGIPILLCVVLGQLFGQEEIPKRIYQTRAIGSLDAPKIDGKINDSSWESVEWSGGYVEWSPEENTTPTEQTQVKILYDDKNLYVAFKCLDSDPSGIVRRLSRRDGFDGDWVEINIDSYHDLRTAFSFTITAAGVKGEEFITNNGSNWDPTWNPIWYAKTAITAEGWTAELRIPLSQIRFGKSGEQVWGIQSTRRYFRKEERSLWQRSPQNAAGWVSGFGELHGLENLDPKRQTALIPYLVSDLQTYPKETGNPFRDGRDKRLGIGLDGKVGITNNMTLDFTINPDFGQVEADPSAIALDGFQIFFSEQRPFFIENKNIFDYKFAASRAGNTFGFDNLFYSRRIGRAPQGFPGIRNGEFSDQPAITTILGAAKVSGKTNSGWSIGILQSVTADESATITDQVVDREERVEPLTNYFVSRIQKDFNDRSTFIGGIFTATNRRLEESLQFLHSSAYSGGLDFKHQWHNRRWYGSGNIVFSNVTGSQQAITRTQRSIRHLFQREGADHLSVDSTRASLAGSGGNLQIGKASGNWRFETGTSWHSPELELNDLGFQRQSDDFRQYSWGSYRTTTPRQRVRQYTLNVTQLAAFDYGRNLNEMSFGLNGWVNLKNNWWINGGMIVKPVNFSNYALRGGPRLRLEREIHYNNGILSDSRRKFRLNLNHSGKWAAQDASHAFDLGATLTWQPTNALQISITPGYGINQNKMEFVANVESSGQKRHIVSKIDQRTFQIPLRIDYIIRPNLSLQYWGQPFISRGRYSEFRQVADPLAIDFDKRFTPISENQIGLAGARYEVDENNDGTVDYRFFQPDFAFVQWRANLVLRWEYVPGSELFLVWSQDLSRFGNFNNDLYAELKQNILDTQPQNIFLLKATYHFMR